MEKKERIALGSGNVYYAEFDGSLPSIEELKTSEHLFSRVKDGCELEYASESHTEKSDDGTVQKTVITDESVVLRPGLIVANSGVVSDLISTARVIDETDRTIVKIGGSNNDNGKSYAILFYHTDAKDGDIAVLIVGKNTAGLKFSFKKDAGSILNPEFTAEPQDDEGTLIQIIFFHPKAASATQE
jgi:hypothetical protein